MTRESRPTDASGRPADVNAGSVDESSLPRVTAAVLIDLRSIDLDLAYRRFTILHAVPIDARVIVLVGSLRVDLRSVDLMRREGARIRWEFQGEPYAVQQWVNALRAQSALDAVGVFLP